jgi:integrase
MEYMSRPFNLKKAPRPQKDPETFSEEDLDRLEKHLKKMADTTLTDEGHRVHARKLRRNKNLYRAFMLARHTLLRSGAIWALQLDKFVLTGEEPFVRIRDCVVETKNSKGELKKTEWKSKKMKWPNKPLNSILLEFLKTDLVNRKPIERYFLDDGRGYAWHEQTGKIARELKIEIEYLGLNIDLKPLHHGVRASGITWLLNQGVPPQTVQHLADHSNISTTMGYFNTRNASQSQAVNMLAKMGKTDKEESPETTT